MSIFYNDPALGALLSTAILPALQWMLVSVVGLLGIFFVIPLPQDKRRGEEIIPLLFFIFLVGIIVAVVLWKIPGGPW